MGEATGDLGESTGNFGEATGSFGEATGDLEPPSDCFDASVLSMADNEILAGEERSRREERTSCGHFMLKKLIRRNLPLITGPNLLGSRVSAGVHWTGAAERSPPAAPFGIRICT